MRQIVDGDALSARLNQLIFDKHAGGHRPSTRDLELLSSVIVKAAGESSRDKVSERVREARLLAFRESGPCAPDRNAGHRRDIECLADRRGEDLVAAAIAERLRLAHGVQ